MESRGELHFRQFHAKDFSPIVLTDEDFAKARVPATQTFEIRDFVERSEIDGRYFDHPYFLAPAGKSATKAYGLLRDALAESGRDPSATSSRPWRPV